MTSSQMTSLNFALPEVDAKETRVATLLAKRGPLEPGAYIFRELYCADTECDCRRAMIQVTDEKGNFQATLSYGWEDYQFYLDWSYGDVESARQVPGVNLYFLAPQTKSSDELLAIFREMMQDEAYAHRIKRHYAQFKQALGEMAKAQHPRRSQTTPKDRRKLRKAVARSSIIRSILPQAKHLPPPDNRER